MPSDDYYAVLMVHPKAEPFIIAAAYRRLSLEYHPDRNKAPGAHARMVEINEAYEVLSDPIKRKTYDSQRGMHRQEEPRRQPRPKPGPEPQRPTRRPTGGPKPPSPESFGIRTGYYDQAAAGAQLWKERAPRIPKGLRWAIEGVSAVSALLCALAWGLSFEEPDIMFPVIGALIVSSSGIQAVERSHDAKRLREHFIPRYNPEPEAFSKYEARRAEYLTAQLEVFVSRSHKYHSSQYCSNMENFQSMPRWTAEQRGADPCMKCGYTQVTPRSLPYPFDKNIHWG